MKHKKSEPPDYTFWAAFSQRPNATVVCGATDVGATTCEGHCDNCGARLEFSFLVRDLRHLCVRCAEALYANVS